MTPLQASLIALFTYIQVSREQCGYLIDVDVLRQTARDAGIVFIDAEQTRARDQGFADAERLFRGLRRSVECSYALKRYGPAGSVTPGLIARRPN